MRQALIPALLAAAVALVAFVTAVASGAPNKPTITFTDPSPSEGVMLTTSSVQFAFTDNRTPAQTHSLVCSLSGPTSSSGPCDTPVASGAGSQSGKSYSGLANGSYTFSVTLKARGGMASATRHFSIAVSNRHLYWANLNGNTIGRANVDGTGVNQSFITGATGTIARANLDGAGANLNFITGTSISSGRWRSTPANRTSGPFERRRAPRLAAGSALTGPRCRRDQFASQTTGSTTESVLRTACDAGPQKIPRSGSSR